MCCTICSFEVHGLKQNAFELCSDDILVIILCQHHVHR